MSTLSTKRHSYSLVAEGITSTTWTDMTPLPGESFYMVSAVKSDNVSAFSAYTSATIQLDAPTIIKAEIDANDLVVNVVWDGVKYAQSYQVYRSSSSSGNYALVAENVASTTWVDSNPLQGENYYKVSAVNRNVVSPPSGYSSLMVQLESPINLKSEIGIRDENFIVNLSWDAVRYAQSYIVYRSSSSNGYYELVADHITTNAWTDSTPVYGNSYYYKVCAINRSVNSPHSSYTPATVQLAAPTNVKAEIDANDLVVNVVWDGVKYAQSYNVYRSSGASDSYTLVAEKVTTNMWTDDNPLEGDNYYKVCATGYGFTSSQSVNVFVNVQLAAPTNVKAEIDANDLVVNVVWDGVKYAQSYKVYRSSSVSGPYTLFAENVVLTTWVDTNPLQGENYYKVSAVNRNIVSSQSSYTSAIVQMDAPTNIKSEMDIKDGQFVVNVSWDVTKNAQSYNVYRSSSNDNYELVAENISDIAWTDLTPLYGSSYYYKVCAKNRNVISPQSSSTAVTVQYEVPENVKSELGIKDDRFVINVSWDAVKCAQSYNIYRSSIDSDYYTIIAERVTANMWTDESPLDGDNYYKICAVGFGFAGALSSCSHVNIVFNLDSPTNVKAETDETIYAVNVSWDAVPNAQSYNVYRSSMSGSYTLLAENVTSTSWIDTNPLQGDNYYVVRASGYGFTSTLSSYAYVNVSWYRTATFTRENFFTWENLNSGKVGNITLSLPSNNTKGFRVLSYDGLKANASGGTFNLTADEGFIIKSIVMTKNTNQKRFNSVSNAPEGTIITEVGGATYMDNMLAIWAFPTGLQEVTVKNNGGAVTLTQIEVMYIPAVVQTP